MNTMFKKRYVALATLVAFVIGLGAPHVTLAASAQNQSPKGILMEMNKRLAEATSVNYVVDLDIDKNVPSDRVHFSMFGSVEQNSALNINRASMTLVPLALEDEEIPPNLAINLITDSSKVYFKASGVPKEFLEEEKQIGKYADTWVRYSQETVDYILKEMASSTDSFEHEMIEAQLSRLKFLENNSTGTALQKEQYKKISDALFKRNAITVTRLADVRLDPSDKTSPMLYRLKITINKWGLGFFVKDLVKIMAEDSAMKQYYGGEMFNEISADITKQIASIKLPTTEILIGKDDYLPRKITMSFYDQTSKKNIVNGALTLSFDGFNAARPITAPDQFKKLEDILKDEKVFETMRAERTRREAGFNTTIAPPATTTPFVILATDHVRGSASSTVTIVEYIDFECPFCAQFHTTLQGVLKDYEGKVRLVVKNFPLDFHENAQVAAEAAECAADQGKFWEMHDTMLNNQSLLSFSQLKTWARDLQLNTEAFNQCLGSSKYSSKVDADIQDGESRGVTATPTIFINNKFYSGNLSAADLKKALDEQLLVK